MSQLGLFTAQESVDLRPSQNHGGGSSRNQAILIPYNSSIGRFKVRNRMSQFRPFTAQGSVDFRPSQNHGGGGLPKIGTFWPPSAQASVDLWCETEWAHLGPLLLKDQSISDPSPKSPKSRGGVFQKSGHSDPLTAQATLMLLLMLMVMLIFALVLM